MNRHDELMELIPDDSKHLVNEVVEEIIFLQRFHLVSVKVNLNEWYLKLL